MADSVMPVGCEASGRGASARLRSAVTTVVRSVTVAAGVFAPGHLGELTRHVPFELVDAVLEQTRTTERRLRMLPSRVGVYFVLALVLFPGLGAGKVWTRLLAGLGPGLRVSVSDKALRDLRRRIGAGPMQALFQVLAGPVAQPSTPGVRFGRYRTVAFDGCVSIKVPDTDRNRFWLGKLKASLGVTGYPALRLMTLVETGTRALLGAGQLLPHVLVSQIGVKAQCQNEIHPDSRRQLPQPPLGGAGLLEHRVDQFEGHMPGQLAQVAGPEHTGRHRDRPGDGLDGTAERATPGIAGGLRPDGHGRIWHRGSSVEV